MTSRTLELGSLCDPISKQLAGMAPKKDLEPFDAMANAITLCSIHGLVGDAETQRARKRLLKKVAKATANPKNLK
jgi:hypothetical protein